MTSKNVLSMLIRIEGYVSLVDINHTPNVVCVLLSKSFVSRKNYEVTFNASNIFSQVFLFCLSCTILQYIYITPMVFLSHIPEHDTYEKRIMHLKKLVTRLPEEDRALIKLMMRHLKR